MTVKQTNKIRKNSTADMVYIVITEVILWFMLVIILIPLVYIVSSSFSSPEAVGNGWVYLWPVDFSLKGYAAVFTTEKVWIGFRNSIFYTVVGTFINIVVTMLAAYPLSRRDLKGRGVVTVIFTFTMLFSGGMVPSYVINSKYLHLKDSFWIYVLPCLVSAWNVFVMRTNFRQLPDGLIEAAKIDGASELRICFQIVLPLCVPVLATLAFSFFVGQWNSWTTTMIYITSPRLYSLQYLLQKILAEAEFLKQMADQGTINEVTDLVPTDSLTYAMAMVAAGPVLVIFPLFQKYFVRGMTIGSVKG